MSASVSLTTNPAAVARRKPILFADGKSHSSAATEVQPPTSAAAVIEAATSSKDLGRHSARNNEPSTVKKTLGDGSTAAPPRRTRKLTGRNERPWWLTAISVFTKNFVLLMVVVGLVQLVRKLAGNSVLMPPELTDFEGQIAEVEGLVKKAVKTLQVQMDVVDKRVGSEVLGLRKKVNEIRDSAGKLGSDVKELVEKSGILEKGMKELRDGDWLSKKEFEAFGDEVKAVRKDRGDSNADVSLDDLKAYAREMLIKEIEKHAADGLGMVDYAVASGGGSVIGHSEDYSSRNGWFSATNRQGVHVDAIKMLKPSFGDPGHCFPLKGSSGYIVIKLRTSIIPKAVTLEHVAKSVAFDRSSAPKDGRVSGWLQGQSDIAGVDDTKILLLTEFTYDLDKSNAQTFDVDTYVGLINRNAVDANAILEGGRAVFLVEGVRIQTVRYQKNTDGKSKSITFRDGKRRSSTSHRCISTRTTPTHMPGKTRHQRTKGGRRHGAIQFYGTETGSDNYSTFEGSQGSQTTGLSVQNSW